jgi:threonine dehydratase
LAAEAARGTDWFDLSTFKEPYRVEGKKTLGFELAESFGWHLPEVLIYPTGGGTGLVGSWKAFAELESLGWIGSERPRMVAVQAEGCAPLVRAFQGGAQRAETWQNAATLAAGLPGYCIGGLRRGDPGRAKRDGTDRGCAGMPRGGGNPGRSPSPGREWLGTT